MNRLNLILTILIAAISFFSCSRSSIEKVGEKASIVSSTTVDTCFCNKGLCDYCVKVIRIIDGDTFHGLTNDNMDVKFRIYAIDAPEKAQDFGTKSRQYLSDLIFGKKVGIKVQSKQDRYGRPIVWVYTDDGKDISAEMLKAGMAWHYKQYSKDEKYAELENQARNGKIGLWTDKNLVAPWEFRKSR